MRPLSGAPAVGEGIGVGLLYALTGGLSVTEASIQRGALLAIDEVNESGGVAGRPLVPVIADYASDVALVATKAQELLDTDGVAVCIGGYTSASRVAMLPVFHARRALLLYTTFFEGLEQDSNVVYTGAIPNQFLFDYVAWILEHLGSRIYMVGSDYVYPRTLGAMTQRLVQEAGGTVLADRYVPLGATRLEAVLEEIARLRPDVVVSNIVGSDSIPAFYRQFHAAGHAPTTLPIASTVTTEIEVQAMGAQYAAGHYSSGSYFSSLRNPANDSYVTSFKARFGSHAVTHEPQIAAYNAVWLFARAATRSASLSPFAVRAAMRGLTFDANPEGWPLVVEANQLTTHPAYIGCARADGQFDVVAEYQPRAPDPFPSEIVGQRRQPVQPDRLAPASAPAADALGEALT
jgi:urea transport system substrate-binding protein